MCCFYWIMIFYFSDFCMKDLMAGDCLPNKLYLLRKNISSLFMMTSSNGNISRVTGLLCGEFTGDRWIPRTKASDTEFWCFLWSVPEPTVEQTLKTDELRCHRAHHDAIVMLKRSGDIMINFPTHVVFVFSRGKSQIICGYLSIF